MWYNSRMMETSRNCIRPMAASTAATVTAAALLLATALAFAVVPAVGGAFAAEDAAKVIRKYPPYPDVWGRVLPFPNDGSYYISAKAYERDDGHILIKTYSGSKLGDQKHIFHVLDFFTGRFKEDKSGIDFLRHPKYRRLLEFDLTLPDGSRIEHKNESFSNCRDTWDLHFVIFDRNGKVVADKMLLALYDRPVRIEVNPYCGLSGDKDSYLAHWRQIQPAFAVLRDGTFLAYESGGVFILRMKPDLTSPFLVKEKRLFLVDRDDVMEVVRGALDKRGAPPIQRVDDAVYHYLLTLRKEKTDAK